MLELFIVIICTGPLWITGLVFLCPYIRDLKIKKMAMLHGPKQRLMFNQLKKGDFVWKINSDNTLMSLCVRKVTYEFDNNGNIMCCYIIFYGGKRIKFDTPYGNTVASGMKKFRSCDYYTLLSEAQTKINMVNAKKIKEIESLKSVTVKELQKSVDEEINHLEK